MPRLSHSTVALILGLGLLVALDGWLRVAERAGYSLPPALGRPLLREALAEQAAVRGQLAATLERERRFEELARAVMDGHLTLREAAAQLRELYRVPDFPWETVARRFPGASEEECCCRMLIQELRSLEGPDRERAQSVAYRLEAELSATI
jgi:hypothetical protein